MNKIIAIAINEYADPAIINLNTCVSDVEILVKTLTEDYQFDDVILKVKPEDTTGNEIYEVLNYHLINAHKEDSILILFAGHGIYNSVTTSTYWQPSDAQSNNAFSWFNISELINMIRASPAKHISIISDSCFAGAIFDSPLRVGGITAYQARKSREALTSGGNEPVRDGKDGEMSPFATTLNEILLSNNLKELPFSILADKVVMEFASDRNQTPRCGGLSNVGHDGGSLIFKRRKRKNREENSIEKLQKGLSNLEFEYSDKENEIIKKLRSVNKAKITAVLSQKYEEASKYRDEEKKMEEDLKSKISDRLNYIFDTTTKKAESTVGNSIDDDYEKYSHTQRKEEEIYIKIKTAQTPKEKEKYESSYSSQLEYFSENIFELFGEEFGLRMQARGELEKLAETDPSISLNTENPNKELWDKYKAHFIDSILVNIVKLLEEFAIAISGASNEELIRKKNELFNYILEIHDLQMKSMFGSSKDDFDEILKRKKLEVNLINWIRDINELD